MQASRALRQATRHAENGGHLGIAMDATAGVPFRAALHGSASGERRATGHNNEEVPDGPPATDFGRMDVLADTPVPSTAVEACLRDGFQLSSGLSIRGGNGVLLVGGEAFSWKPWRAGKSLVNGKGQWGVDSDAFGLLGLVWPRPGR